jgi:hypothetical protein
MEQAVTACHRLFRCFPAHFVLFEHDLNPRRARRNIGDAMMWLMEMLASLSAEQMVNLLSAALCLALAGGMNERLGALVAAVLALVMVGL